MMLNKSNSIICMITMLLLSYVLIALPVGMANNGEYARALSQNNLYTLETVPNDQFFGYFVNEYGVREYFNELKSPSQPFTSQTLFIQCAMIIDRVFTGIDHRFDIRFLGGLNGLLFLVGLYLILDYLTYQKNLLTGILIGICCMFSLADTSYIAYFNSFYYEGLAYALFLTTFGSMLLLGQKRYSPYFLYGVFWISSLLLILLKRHYYYIGLILGCLSLYIAIKNRKTEPKSFKRLFVFGGGGLIIVSLCAYTFNPIEFSVANQYHAMTRGILMAAENQEVALSDFNIEGNYSLLQGEIYDTSFSPIDLSSEETKEAFLSKYTPLGISLYYFKHPTALHRMFSYAANNAYSPRSTSIGNYLKSSGKGYGAQTTFFTLSSQVRLEITPNNLGFLLLWCLMAVVINLKNHHQRLTIGAIVLIGLSQIFTSIVNFGYADLGRHLFLFTVGFDLVNLIGFAYIIGKFISATRLSLPQKQKYKAKRYQTYKPRGFKKGQYTKRKEMRLTNETN